MALPSTQDIPVATSLYPDRVVIGYQYLLSQSAPMASLLPILREHHGFEGVRRGFAARAKVPCDMLEEPIEVEASKTGPKGPLRFTAYLNPLREFHRHRTDYGGERGRAAAHNWLHPDEIRESCAHVVAYAHEMIVVAERVLFEIADDIARRVRGRAEFEGMYVKSVEVAYDLAADDPDAMTRRLGLRIQERFRHSVVRGYRQSACGYQSLDGDVHMTSGYSREGELYKVYAKTNRRVRIECRVDPPAFRVMGLRRDLGEHDEFPALFSALAEGVLPNFLEVLEAAPGAPIESAGPLDFLTHLAHSIRSPAIMRDVIIALSASGRITRDFGLRGLGSRLHAAGILARVGRGLYGIAPRYRQAQRIVASAQSAWLDFTPAREERP